MKRRNTLLGCLSVFAMLLSISLGAQTFPGNTTNTAGNSAIPSSGTGSCFSAPQTTGGTLFENNVAGLAGAEQLLSVTLNISHTWDSDLDVLLEAPNGERIKLFDDVGGSLDNFVNTNICDNAPQIIFQGSAPFTGNYRPEGGAYTFCSGYPTNVNTLAQFTAGQNGTWVLRIFDDAGGDVGTMNSWSLTFGDPACQVGNLVLPDITIPGVTPGVCGAEDEPVTAPALPGNCGNVMLSVYLNDNFVQQVAPGGQWLLTGPTGNHVIRYETSPCDQVEQNVTITDGVPPTVVCPGDVTLNLDPGACDIVYNYTVTCDDNCPLTAQGQVDHPIDFNNGQAGVMFDLVNLGPIPLIIDEFQPSLDPGTFTMEVYYVTAGGTWQGNQTNPGAWTLAGSGSVTSTGANPGTPVPGYNITIPPGGTVGVYITSTAGFPMNYTGIGAGTQREFNDGTLSVDATPGAGKGYPFGITFISRAYNGGVTYSAAIDADPLLVSGLPSGSLFPIGSTTQVYQCEDAVGNTATCSFTVTVNEYPNPVTTLSCNDLVNISLDETCSYIIGADDILEGGPHGCYDDYIVELDKTLPLGNGPWIPAVLGASDIGKTYAARVTDPDTGNNCWGLVYVEDKIEPVLDCPAAELPCNCDGAPCLEGDCSQTLTSASLQQDVPFTNYWTGYMNNITNLTGFDVNVTGCQVQASLAGAGAGTYNLKAYMKAGTFVGFEADMAAWTLVADEDVDITAGFPTVLLYELPFNNPFAVPANGQAGIYIVANDGAGTTVRVVATISTQPTSDAFLQIDNNPGRWVNGMFGGVAFANENPRPQLRLDYQAAVLCDVPMPNGLGLGDAVQIGPDSWRVFAGAGTPQMENCSDVTLAYVDSEVPGDCTTGLDKTINRKWTATDESGNSTTCIQVIDFALPTFNDLTTPPDYDDIDAPAFECGGAYPTPEWIEAQGAQGFPYIFDDPEGCTISYTYEDVVIDVCDGTYKILRKWDVIDWCAGESIEHNQIVKVLDSTGPSIDCPADITVSTDPFTCCATVNLPDAIVTDECSRINNISWMVVGIDQYTFDTIGMFTGGGQLVDFPGNNYWNPDTLAQVGYTPCLPIGTHQVYYTVEDDCGNVTTCNFSLTVRDYTPPVAACDEFTIVSIGIDDPFDCYEPSDDGCEFAGVTWIKATTFDDGSYDNCGNVRFTIRRMAPYSDCILGLNPINGQPDCDDFFPDFPSEFERAISEYDSIKFYCCEVGTSQMVILRVYQTDINGNITIGPDGTPVYNECMIEVEVQDKIKPVCQPPANVTVSCENFDPSLWAYGKASVYDNCCLDTAQVYQGQKGLSHSVNYALFDTLCNKGTITRTFRAFDCHGFSSQCTQRIVVNYEQDYYVKFPNDVIVNECDGTGNYGEPEFYGEDCELMGVSYEDEIFTVVPDACYKIERTWRIINWCTYNPNAPCIEVPNPNPNAITNHPSNLPGPIVSANGTPQPWNPTIVKINPSDQFPTNYSTFWDADANCYVYKQVIKIVDNEDPVFDNCPASPVEICDLTPNDPLFWNDHDYWDATIGSHDLCEAPTELCVTVTDSCGGADVNVRYLLFLDMDGDGVMETEISSTNQPAPNEIPYLGGTPFDHRPVPFQQKYRFAIDWTTSGTARTACVRWDWLQQPANLNDNVLQGVVPQLPYGTHKIKWFAEDGCGNEAICEYTFVVKDCKKPTVVCINGLSVNIMPTGMITLWASDFLQYTEDNCTPSDQIDIAIVKSSQSTGTFPVDGLGNPITNVTFDCSELGPQPVQLWARDAAGNADFCETYVIVQDNMGNCNPGDQVSVAGALKTETDNGLEEASVELSGSHPAFPPVSMFDMSDNAGLYDFNQALPLASNYTVTPLKDDNHLNGVTTFDLVLISKHILGLEPLDTPYKMIAADANKSNSITTFDIVELRKLILGIYNELPNNTSWRFVDKAFNFADPANPFSQQFPEFLSVADVQANQMDDDFVSVKVGDVNGSAIANSFQSADDRTAGTLLIDVKDREVKAGEEFVVNFTAAERVLGYQFTMNYAGLEVVDVVPGSEMSMDNFGVFADAITTSFDGNTVGEFAVKFRAATAGMLSDMIGVSSRITKSEAYNDGAERLDVAFRFNGTTIAGVGFELYQNMPNPFVNKTMIGFHLPQSAEATLTIFDETGRMLYTQTGEFAKGYNAIAIDRSQVGAVGVLYYKVETDKHSATRKMIQTK